MAYGNDSIFLAVPATGIAEFPATASGNASPAATIAPSGLKYPGGIAIDVSVTPPVIYQVDYTGNALYVIQTAGLAPYLTAAGVTTISGAATGLSGPLDVLVVH